MARFALLAGALLETVGLAGHGATDLGARGIGSTWLTATPTAIVLLAHPHTVPKGGCGTPRPGDPAAGAGDPAVVLVVAVTVALHTLWDSLALTDIAHRIARGVPTL